jgi:soluble P-type ATPase
MIELNIPGQGIFQIEYLVSDVNGTLALDGALLPGVASIIRKLHERIKVYLITIDSHLKQNLIDSQISKKAKIIQKGQDALQKSEFVKHLGAINDIAIGQEAKDSQMLKTTATGICVLYEEGPFVDTMLSSDLVFPDGLSALKLIQNPLRMVATLRR